MADLFGPPKPPPDPWPHPACLDEEALLRECKFGRGRSSGPGGQHRNKVETAVTATHESTGVIGFASERRSSGENRRVAIRRLRLALAIEVRLGAPAGEVGSKLWRSRLKGTKILCNPKHWDYPAMLAEALDVVAAAGWDPKKAALRLNTTASQLIKLVQEHPPAMVMWNAERQTRAMHPLR